ncbi:MAG: peptidase [Lachnospiraceae bacterium]|nr:peptidase [Lachnospiraceae bacterium]
MRNKPYKITAILLAAGLAVLSPLPALADTPVITAGSSQTGGGPGAGPGTGPGVAPAAAPNAPDQVVPVVEKYSYDQMVQDLNTLQGRYGAHLQVHAIGTSLDGRTLYEAVLGNPDAPKHILIHGGIHAREYMTPLLVMKQLEYGAEFYDTGTFRGEPYSGILNSVAVHFVPMVNPDGIALSQFGLDAIRSEELRQQIQQAYQEDLAQGRTQESFDRYLTRWKTNGRGVDLNQNFPANWDLVTASPVPSYGTYKGTSPLSEPESQALADLVNSRTWSATVSYHSMGNVIYWDYPGNQVQQASGELATVVAGLTGYQTLPSSGHGGFKDWTQIKENPVPGITVEVGSVSCPLPLSQYQEIWNSNWQVWILVAKYAMTH